MADLKVGTAAALSPRIDFDLENPIARGFQIGQQADYKKALAAQKRQEQLNKILDKSLSLDPEKVHATLRNDAMNLVNSHLEKALSGNADPYELAADLVRTKQGMKDIAALSAARTLYDSDRNIIKNPEIARYFAAGDNKKVMAELKKSYDLGEYTESQNPFGTAYAERYDLKKVVSDNYAYGADGRNASLYVPLKQETGPFGDIKVTYGIDPKKRQQIIDELYDRETVLPNIMYGSTASAYRKERDAVEFDPQYSGLTPEEKTDMAARNVIDQMLPTYVEKDNKPGEGMKVSIGIDTTPKNDRSLFTDLSTQAGVYMKSDLPQKANTYADFMKGMNSTIGGQLYYRGSDGENPFIKVTVPANELNKVVELSPADDQLSFGVGGKERRLAGSIAVKTSNVFMGVTYKDETGNNILITKDNYSQYKDKMKADNVYPAFVVEYVSAPTNDTKSPIAGLETDTYNSMVESGKSELGNGKMYQVFSADEFGSTALTARYPELTASYNKVIKGSLTKTGERVKNIETNTQPKPGAKKVATGQTAAPPPAKKKKYNAATGKWE